MKSLLKQGAERNSMVADEASRKHFKIPVKLHVKNSRNSHVAHIFTPALGR